MSKPNVLVVTRNLPPLVGGMERLIWHVVDELRESYHVHVVGPAGCESTLPHDVQAKGVQIRPLSFFLLRVFLKAFKTAISQRPTVVFAGSGLTAPIVWVVARFFRSRCIVYLHGLDLCAAHPLYRRLWVPFFRYFDSVIVNSHFTKKLAIEAKVAPNRITVIHPGVEIPDLEGAEDRCIDFRARHGLAQAPVMLYVGRINPRKGLLFFVENILSSIIKAVPNAILVVIGEDADNALQTVSNEHRRVNSVLKEKGLETSVRFLGSCSDEELGNAYFSADVLVFPVQPSAHDVEGFGMVAIEAAAHGLPTVAFSVGGVPDAVADGCCGRLIVTGDDAAFEQAVIELLQEKWNIDQKIRCRDFASLFLWNKFGVYLRELFVKI